MEELNQNMEERLMESQVTDTDETVLDITLRPQKLEDFVGQKQIKRN